jgi:uncharacterized protein YecE (DUF72 family)
MTDNNLRIGCAGWTIPGDHAAHFPAGESHLQRYSKRFNAVEINTSFNKLHRRKTYEDWAAVAPPGFQFAVKLWKQITHTSRLADLAALGYFLPDVRSLGDKMGPLLVQLPPSLAFDAVVVGTFFSALRDRFTGGVVCEPRHATWFTPEADDLLNTFQVARVAADPAPTAPAAQPGGWPGLVYYRLHGAPPLYYSAYDDAYIQALAASLREKAQGAPVWCIFDNTAMGAATGNALTLLKAMNRASGAL